jgi:uncharacterized iron-regulated membrane protein
MNLNKQRQIVSLRTARRIHRLSGIYCFIFLALVSITGILLGWKKHSGDTLMPRTMKGSSAALGEWLPLDSLHTLAVDYLSDTYNADLNNEVDRMDVRQDKGIVKVTFKGHNRELQIDGATGELLHAGRRRADVIEAVHDGSIIDDWLGIRSGTAKLMFTTLMGLALFLFIATGLWLYYGPKVVIRQSSS